MITIFKNLRHTCINQLEVILDKEIMEECREFIEIRRERRHLSTLERHLSKFQILCHENQVATQAPSMVHKVKIVAVHVQLHVSLHVSLTSTSTSTIPEDDQKDEHPGTRFKSQETLTYTISENWVRNLSKTPLTEVQESLLGHGPNFVPVPKGPPACEYIAATEKACQNLLQGKAEELRAKSSNY